MIKTTYKFKFWSSLLLLLLQLKQKEEEQQQKEALLDLGVSLQVKKNILNLPFAYTVLVETFLIS